MSTFDVAELTHRRTVGLLLCAMLLMQLAGLWHGVVHAHGPLQALHEGAHSADALPHPTGLADLFAHHGDGADCRVFDQLSHANALGFARLEPGDDHPVLRPLRARPLTHVAAQPSGVPARGPPALA